ncbi:GNAT family N-acetyltransferase [Gilvimarinus sp. DA14]|uniref:GNAT family N-acetyltransferase n=1 Tax=Gilvimarinus sp. DA14 TaxID=2956798 RepID=UPI0020B6E8F1|nr:GNAT family N-acetyltransferase [Gilvimarinus sp. DA14]UTF59804.1 GNAT family N-acetyltransferase [Gilvimarinus sp. DA14]
MSEASASRCRVEPLGAHPEWLELVAQWHHSECLRQGLSSRYERRLRRLRAHTIGGQSVPQTWLAFSNSQAAPVGCISIVSYQLNTSAGVPAADVPLWLSNLYVEPEQRRRGIAACLIAKVEAFAQQLGHDSLWLIAKEHTEFYTRRHWQTLRKTRIAKQWVNVMRREL